MLAHAGSPTQGKSRAGNCHYTPLSCASFPQHVWPALFLRPAGFDTGDLGGAVEKLTTLCSPAGLVVLTLASPTRSLGLIPGGGPPLRISELLLAGSQAATTKTIACIVIFSPIQFIAANLLLRRSNESEWGRYLHWAVRVFPIFFTWSRPIPPFLI